MIDPSRRNGEEEKSKEEKAPEAVWEDIKDGGLTARMSWDGASGPLVKPSRWKPVEGREDKYGEQRQWQGNKGFKLTCTLFFVFCSAFCILEGQVHNEMIRKALRAHIECHSPRAPCPS